MKLSRRAARLLLLLGAGLFLGLLFSVHQAVYWGIVLVFAVGLAFYGLVQVVGRDEERYTPPPRSILQDVNYWRLSLQLGSDEGPATIGVKDELQYYLVAMYATKQPEAAPFTIREALQARQLPLPDTVYNFLFCNDAQEMKLTWKGRLQRLAAKPGKWLRHWSGRDKAEYYRAVEETITFMEALMEIKHGDDYFDPPKPDL
jgi:hypothetical protein